MYQLKLKESNILQLNKLNDIPTKGKIKRLAQTETKMTIRPPA